MAEERIRASSLRISIKAILRATITAVTARQRYPWNGLVDITVTLAGTSNEVAKTECTFVATNSATQAAIRIDHLTCTGTVLATEETTWTRSFIWDATADVGEVKIEEVALTAIAEWKLGGVQLWKDGPYWAECNVGATKPEEYGYYFWWGDTVGYKRDASDSGWVSVKDGGAFAFTESNCLTYGKSNSSLLSLGYIDSTGNLVAAHDTATVHLGAPWRMPTSAEIDALVSNCITTWTTRNGVYGRLIAGKGDYASRSIFLPAAGIGNGADLYRIGSYGHFWSSTPHSGYSDCASCYLRFNSSNFGWGDLNRYLGLSIRPLRESAK